MKPEVSIVIPPTRNRTASVTACEKYRRMFWNKQLAADIIVVDDGSRDETSLIAENVLA
jgi:glycosyltransferase involved in cell wall biosynthesis